MWLKHVSWTLCHPNIKAYYTALRFYGGSWGLQDFIKGENCKKKKKIMITEYVNSDSKVINDIHMYHICLLLGLYPHFCGSEHGMYWCSWVTNKWKLSCNLIRYTGFPQKIMLKEQQSTFYSKKSMPLLNSARNDKFLYFMTISLLLIGCLCTYIIYFICLFIIYFTSLLYIASGGVSMFNSLILSCTVSDPGEIEWSKNVIFLCLIFYIKPKTCSFFM